MLLNLESGAYAFTADPDEGTLTMGRENDCNFVVKEEGISRHHCKLWFEDGNWLVEDCESRWGTLVNNKQVQQPTELKHGDVLRLSSVTFMVTLHRTNDHGAIGKQLAGGARDKLKLLNDNNKASAKASRTLRAPGKDSNKRLPKAAPKAEEVDEEIPDSDTAASASTTEESSAPEGETSSEESSAEDSKKGSKLKIPAKGLSGKTSASRTARAGKGAKEAPKKGGGMVKTLIAVVVLAGGGAGAYFATDGFGMNTPAASVEKKPDEAVAKPDAAKDEPKEVPKDAPAAPVIPPIPPKDKEEAKPEEKAGNTGNSEPDAKQ